MKLYQVILQDEYNNLYEVGLYKSLDDSIKDLNKELEVYNIKLEKGDLREYPSTFGQCFDCYLSDLAESKGITDQEKIDEMLGVQIRGFILDSELITERISKLEKKGGK